MCVSTTTHTYLYEVLCKCVCVFLFVLIIIYILCMIFDRPKKSLRLSVLVIIGYISIVKCNWISVWIYTLIVIVIDATIIVRIVSPWQIEFIERCVCVRVCVFCNCFLSWRDGMCTNWYGTPDEERKKRHIKILHRWQQQRDLKRTNEIIIVGIVRWEYIAERFAGSRLSIN